ncbi:glutamate receptor 3.3 [Cryptomeria japonica]|uniref:glutamate receptor 3.3 n=1 Tax=Cryptomeria japonica TaxID=3369 RepID=UPI0027DA0F9E|nr:glutamate receptor 3.3 [Cryptomeria japonica]
MASRGNYGYEVALDTTNGKLARTAIELAVEDVNRNTSVLNGTILNIHIRDSKQDALTGASAALELIRKGCVSIVGPQTSVVAEFVGYLGVAAHVPVVTFGATNPSLSMHRYPYFIRTVPNDKMQMRAIAKLVDLYRWRDVALVYDDMGTGAVPAITDALREVEANIVLKAAVPPQANVSSMRKLLEDELMGLESRVFIVHMHDDLALMLFSEASKLGMIGSEYVWIITDACANLLDWFNITSLLSMNGVLGIRRTLPQTDQRKMNEFAKRWKQRRRAQNPTIQKLELNARALVAYDTTWALAYAIDHLLRQGSFNGGFSATSSSTEILNFKFFDGGEDLLNQILDTRLGLSGPVRISRERDESLECSYDIINVIGNSYKVVGSWTEKGLNISSKHVVHWGGGSRKTPRGWVKPAPGKKYKIAVPWLRGFTQFIRVKPDLANAGAQNQIYEITGFSIDVFSSVLKRMDYKLPYELIPYGTGNVTAGYYDDLVYQVYLQKFDAVVGDVTVLANRSKYVDFTQPYTESGLIMVVALSDKRSSDSWAFLRPFTPAMWIATFTFFIFTGGVVWCLEHRQNRQFRGTPRKQVFTLIWFSFSTLFTTQRERIVSSLGKAVVLIWLFVAFVLVSSYTASLSSMLTEREIVPKVESVESLITQNLPIGYRQGSFIDKYLEQQLGVNKSVLRPYSSAQEYVIALKKGPSNGGVAAVFGGQTIAEKIFLSTGCKDFEKLGPTYKTGGFAFVFPKGSPLVSDISKAILNLSESKDMQEIRKRWLHSSESKCSLESGGVESNKLSLKNFWGIFLLTGCVSFLTLVYYLCRLIYRFVHKNENSSHVNSVSTRLRKFANYADKKEISTPKRKRYKTASLPKETSASISSESRP